MFGLILLSTSVSAVDLVTLKFQADKHPILTTSPQPVGPSASSTASTSQTHALYYLTLYNITYMSYWILQLM
jgi:hypothetical protein